MDPKQQILEEAHRLFMMQGYRKTYIRQISENIGIEYGSIHLHFPSGKDGILNELMNQIITQFYSLLDTDDQPQSIEDIKTTNNQQITDIFRIVAENKEIMQVFWVASGNSPIVISNFLNLKKQFIQKIKIDIQSKNELGFGKPINQELAASGYIHLVWGFIWDYVLGELDDPDEIITTIVAMYMGGVYL